MNLDNMAATMQMVGYIFAKGIGFELNTASNILNNVAIFTANSFHIESQENDRMPYLDLSRRRELVFLELRTLNSLCIITPILISIISR